jgi:hypothetical protein
MFIYRPRDMSTVQSEVRRQTPAEELEGESVLAPSGGDGGEAAEEGLADGVEVEPEAEEEQVAVNSTQSQLSKSQKRRRHRR